MKTLAIVLVIAGVVALVYGGFSYTRDRKVVDLGPLEITASENRSFPIPAVVGAAVLLGGVLRLVNGNRRSRPL